MILKFLPWKCIWKLQQGTDSILHHPKVDPRAVLFSLLTSGLEIRVENGLFDSTLASAALWILVPSEHTYKKSKNRRMYIWLLLLCFVVKVATLGRGGFQCLACFFSFFSAKVLLFCRGQKWVQNEMLGRRETRLQLNKLGTFSCLIQGICFYLHFLVCILVFSIYLSMLGDRTM